MFMSKVVVANCSTMLRENLAAGGKVLSCNLAPVNIWNFPIEGICSIKNCNFEQFEKRLLQIYSIPKKKYFSKLNKKKSYIAEFDSKISTIKVVKNKIDHFLNT